MSQPRALCPVCGQPVDAGFCVWCGFRPELPPAGEPSAARPTDPVTGFPVAAADGGYGYDGGVEGEGPDDVHGDHGDSWPDYGYGSDDGFDGYGPDDEPTDGWRRRRRLRLIAFIVLALLVIASSAYVTEWLLPGRVARPGTRPDAQLRVSNQTSIVTTTTEPPPVEVAALLDDHAAAVWKVEVEGCGYEGFGTAWAIDARHLVTNAHVVQIDSQPTLTARDGTQIRGTIVGRDDALDVAVVETEFDVPATLDWAPVDDLAPGQQVLALGHPIPGDFEATVGTITGFAVEDDRRTAVGTDAHLDRGNSGGPLLTHRGLVAGVVTRANLDEDEPSAHAYTEEAFGAEVRRMIAEPATIEPSCDVDDLDGGDSNEPTPPAPPPAPPTTVLSPCPSGRTVVQVTVADATARPDGSAWDVAITGRVVNETTAAIRIDGITVEITGTGQQLTAWPQTPVLAPGASSDFAVADAVATVPDDSKVEAALTSWTWDDPQLGHCGTG